MTEKSVQLIQMNISELTEIISNCLAKQLEKIGNQNTKPQKTETEILTREEVKDLLKISYTSLWKYNKQKTLIARKANGKVFYMRQDVMNLLNNNVA